MVLKLEASTFNCRAGQNTDCWAPPPEFLIHSWVGTCISNKFLENAEAASLGQLGEVWMQGTLFHDWNSLSEGTVLDHRVVVTEYHNWVAYRQQKFISHSS